MTALLNLEKNKLHIAVVYLLIDVDYIRIHDNNIILQCIIVYIINGSAGKSLLLLVVNYSVTNIAKYICVIENCGISIRLATCIFQEINLYSFGFLKYFLTIIVRWAYSALLSL